ncbi:MAG TPA: hypothetical protein PKU91_05280, partial [Phycisphaerales bacterium]|nr:hypothetical protein [Phycisphaerales bacterium]
MRISSSIRAAGRLAIVLALAGSVLGIFAESADAQEGRRRRTGQDARPIELTPEQVTQITKVANDRRLNSDDLIAAAKTFMPSGRHDEYVLFSSG